MKKWILLIMISTFLIAGCSTSSENTSSNSALNGKSNEAAVEIEFWHAMSGDRDEAINEIVENFNNEQDEVIVKAINQGNGKYADLEKKLMAAGKANQLPAVSQVTATIVPEFTKNGFVEELNPYIENEDYGLTDDSLEDIIEPFREASIWDGSYYTLPFGKSIRVLYYNKGILEEHGFDVPETWDELKEIAIQVTNDNVVGMGFENDFYLEYQSLLAQMGGKYIDEEKNEVLFNSKEGIQALQFIKDLFDEGAARMPGEDGFLSGPFARGDVAMYITSSPGVTHIRELVEDDLEWSTAVLPAYDGSSSTSFFGNEILMYSQSTEEEKIAAWKFMKYLISTEVTTEWATKSGYLPARYSAIESEEYKNFLEEDPEFLPSVEQFDAAIMSPRIPGAKAIENILFEEFDEVILDRKTVEEALDSAETRANEELNK